MFSFIMVWALSSSVKIGWRTENLSTFASPILRVMAKSNTSHRYPVFAQNIYKKENTGIIIIFESLQENWTLWKYKEIIGISVHVLTI